MFFESDERAADCESGKDGEFKVGQETPKIIPKEKIHKIMENLCCYIDEEKFKKEIERKLIKDNERGKKLRKKKKSDL